MALPGGLSIVLLGAALAGLPAGDAAGEGSAWESTSASAESTRVPVEAPAAVEVLRDEKGPYAVRRRAADGRWALPPGDAVLLEEAWWTPLRPLEAVPRRPVRQQLRSQVRAAIAPATTEASLRRLVDVDLGDVTADGEPELAVAFRRPFRRTFINVTRPRDAWADQDGLSAHVGLYDPRDGSQLWVAGTLSRPVQKLAACDGALAVAYGHLDRPGTPETSAWRWAVFGFLPADALPGRGHPICVDIDADGRTEPAIVRRAEP